MPAIPDKAADAIEPLLDTDPETAAWIVGLNRLGRKLEACEASR